MASFISKEQLDLIEDFRAWVLAKTFESRLTKRDFFTIILSEYGDLISRTTLNKMASGQTYQVQNMSGKTKHATMEILKAFPIGQKLTLSIDNLGNIKITKTDASEIPQLPAPSASVHQQAPMDDDAILKRAASIKKMRDLQEEEKNARERAKVEKYSAQLEADEISKAEHKAKTKAAEAERKRYKRQKAEEEAISASIAIRKKAKETSNDDSITARKKAVMLGKVKVSKRHTEQVLSAYNEIKAKENNPKLMTKMSHMNSNRNNETIGLGDPKFQHLFEDLLVSAFAETKGGVDYEKSLCINKMNAWINEYNPGMTGKLDRGISKLVFITPNKNDAFRLLTLDDVVGILASDEYGNAYYVSEFSMEHIESRRFNCSNGDMITKDYHAFYTYLNRKNLDINVLLSIILYKSNAHDFNLCFKYIEEAMKFKTEVYKGGLNIPVTTGLLTKILAFWKWNDKKYRTFKADDMASSNHHITATTFIPLTKELTAILSYTVERKYLPKVISGEIANEHMNMFNLTLVLNRGE